MSLIRVDHSTSVHAGICVGSGETVSEFRIGDKCPCLCDSLNGN